MALTDIILPKGKVIVTKSASSASINPTGKALNFGYVQRVNDLCDVTLVGGSVWFDEKKSIPFMVISGTTFYLVNEDDIVSTEITPP